MNPISVQWALYGAPGNALQVMDAVQGIFDGQYNNDPATNIFTLKNIQPSLFNIPDPAPGKTKTFTIAYQLWSGTPQEATFARAAHDSQTLTLIAGPARKISVFQAFYATSDRGFDVTEELAAYLSDPGNSTSLEVGSQQFLNIFCGGSDPAPSQPKYFSVVYSAGKGTMVRCGHDGETVDIS
jgi:hypothetical protein